MELSTESKQEMCRLCLENEKDNGGFLVDMFSALINEPGKLKFAEKLKALFGLQIHINDQLPSLVCHKCLVFTDNCMEFREKVMQNDEKIRLIFKVNQEVNADEATEEVSGDIEPLEEETEEVITLNPNTLYESSDESEAEISTENVVMEHPAHPTLASSTVINTTPPVPPQKVGNGKDKKDIFHCRFCDVVFVDEVSCNQHEFNSHDNANPFVCVVCSYKCSDHTTLICHIKQKHSMEKPHLCTQCSKAFNRRSDLRKHTFVHAGIRLYICNVCNKSFTRNTNLTKHKRTHSENAKGWKCQLCPSAFYTNSDLSRHLEVHMDPFSRRDQLEQHQKTHIMENQATTAQQIVFYNQPPEQLQQPLAGPMNFYTESLPSNPNAMQLLQPKTEYPIMNQLLSGLNQSMLQPTKNFVCGICGNTFFKKKELDRHVLTIHTSVKQYSCGNCPKTFNRRDKLLRHEKTHNVANVFNCSLCPAVFVRKQMLDFHSKIHNGENQGQSQLETFLASFQKTTDDNNGVNQNLSMDVEVPQNLMSRSAQSSASESPSKLLPMNLSVKSPETEPMNLSNDREESNSGMSITKVEKPPTKITIDSDDDDGLRIVEESLMIKKSPSLINLFNNLPRDAHETTIENGEVKPRFDEPLKNIEDLRFAMTSRITMDLPMEILNND